MNQFSRTSLILGDEAMKKLAHSRVAVFGLGGVGGYVVEGLARAGVGALDLVDNDKISITNLNRQIFALHSTVGQSKTTLAAARVSEINPDCKVTTHDLFYLPETADNIDLSQFDYIVDAVDTVSAKLYLAQKAQEAGVPIISSMGTGNKLDPTAFRVSDISETNHDALARVMRKELKKRGVKKLKVVWSPEMGIRADAVTLEEVKRKELSPDSSRRDVPGSVSFVPAVAGMILAGEVVKDLIKF